MRIRPGLAYGTVASQRAIGYLPVAQEMAPCLGQHGVRVTETKSPH